MSGYSQFSPCIPIWRQAADAQGLDPLSSAAVFHCLQSEPLILHTLKPPASYLHKDIKETEGEQPQGLRYITLQCASSLACLTVSFFPPIFSLRFFFFFLIVRAASKQRRSLIPAGVLVLVDTFV